MPSAFSERLYRGFAHRLVAAIDIASVSPAAVWIRRRRCRRHLTGACVVAPYGNMPLTSPMAVSETLARTMIQNASRSMAGDFCEDKQRHSRTGPQTAFAARSITVLANRYRLNLMRESQSSQRCGSNIEMVWHFCRVKTFALFHADSLRTPASRLRASTRSRESARVPPDTRREASTTKASR